VALLPALILALAFRGDTLQRSDSATYESAALRALVTEAAELNRLVPAGLGGYIAHLESEISIGNRRSEGQEMAVSLEQVASTLTWDRTGAYQQRVDGYRTQAIGTTFSSLGLFRSGWAIPSLYGNRIALLFGRDTSQARRRSPRRRQNEPLYAIHPLATDRERYYRFRGGDTVVIMRANGREIPIVRVEVSLREDLPAKSVVFLGEMDLDTSRRHIVRIRGYFAVVGGAKPKFDLLRQAGLQGVAYVEAENAEVEGSFWLPLRQRFEAHATSSTVGEGRAVFRILTRFVTRELTPAPPDVVIGAAEDTLRIQPFRLAIASADSLRAFKDWNAEMGAMTAEVSAEDFNDVAPDRWRPNGAPRFTLETERLGDVMRVDRVQGFFTGIGAVMRFRDAAPGLTLRGTAGWAWTEETARGRVVVEHRTARGFTALRAQRSLDLTNDFRNPFDSGSTTGAIFGRDNYDYVDRWTAGGQVFRLLGGRRQAQVRLDVSFAEDRDVTAHLTESPIGIGRDFRANRVITQGRYTRSTLIYEYRPDVALEFLRAGSGMRLSYERGDGELTYQRAELRLTTRRNRGPFSLGARLDLGITDPQAPPQQLFELGEDQNLPGYDYKEFAGDQAAVLRAGVLWRLPYLGAPLRITQRIWLPPAAPAIGLGVQSGWTRVSDADALATVTALGSRATGHPRTTVSASLRFFGGAAGVVVARPVDAPGPVRVFVEFGQRW
jgi:hypothetical protein